MLKISQTAPPAPPITLRLEGRVVGPWVDELRVQCDRWLGHGAELRLSLEEVTFVDRSGVTLLHGLRARGVRLLGCSPFVEEELK
jgi:ABC-type transporter Mla MlaB component